MASLFSCKKGYFYSGINDDPSQLKNPLPSNLLPGIIQSTGYEWGGDASRFPSTFMQQTTGIANQSLQANRYAVSADDVNNMWTSGLYGGGIMNNAHSLIIIADSLKQYHYAAIGRILMANALGLTTDFWGDVPYTQAFQGVGNTQPKYDTQQQIYDTLFQLLNKAIAALGVDDGSPFQPGAEDLLYGGDLDKWARFAHALKAKFYLHLVKVDAANYDKALAEIPDAFSASSDDAGVLFNGASVASENPWSQFNSQRGDIGFTGYIYDLLEANGDPRLAVYSDGDGGLGTLYGSPNSTVYLMSYDELKFIEAEAAFQKNNKEAAASAYNAAVSANLIRTVGNDNYLAKVRKTAADITLQDIMTQKYIANFLNPEVWADWRRTGLPALTPAPGGVLGGQLPRTLLYPSGEQRYNANAPKNTSMTRRVWWDK
jgi:hypothetical protein